MHARAPEGPAVPAAGDPGAPQSFEVPAPVTGNALDRQQQAELGFEHRVYVWGDPKGASWSKFNDWSMKVIANDQRDFRLGWVCAQEGGLWRATLQVRRGPRPEPWEKEVVSYTGPFAKTKRDAKEGSCSFLLLEQRRLNRLPDFTPP